MRQAVIVCGGRGRRLSSIAGDLPKALVSIMGKPLLFYQIEELWRHGVEEVILCVGHGADAIRSFFGDGSSFSMRILYAQEKTALGTAGAVRAIRQPLDRHFFVIYGDLLFFLDLNKLAHHHYEHQALATLVLHHSDHPYDSDLVALDNGFRITGFLGKPQPSQPFFNLTNAAIYAIDRRILDAIPADCPTDFAQEIFPSLLKKGDRLIGFVTNEYCKDIGVADRYWQAIEDLREGKVHAQSRTP